MFNLLSYFIDTDAENTQFLFLKYRLLSFVVNSFSLFFFFFTWPILIIFLQVIILAINFLDIQYHYRMTPLYKENKYLFYRNIILTALRIIFMFSLFECVYLARPLVFKGVYEKNRKIIDGFSISLVVSGYLIFIGLIIEIVCILI
jgi:hypothetical protein